MNILKVISKIISANKGFVIAKHQCDESACSKAAYHIVLCGSKFGQKMTSTWDLPKDEWEKIKIGDHVTIHYNLFK